MPEKVDIQVVESTNLKVINHLRIRIVSMPT